MMGEVYESDLSKTFAANYYMKKESFFSRFVFSMHEPKYPKTMSKQECQALAKMPIRENKIPLQYPFTAMGTIEISSFGKKVYGFGTLISKKFILTTASNCFDKETKKQYSDQFMFFLPFSSNKKESRFSIKRKYYEPDFRKYLNQAINYAILQLNDDIGDNFGYLGLSWIPENLMGFQHLDSFQYNIEKKQLLKRQVKFNLQNEQEKVKRFRCSTFSQQKICGNPLMVCKLGKFYIAGLVLAKENQGIYLEFKSADVKNMNSWFIRTIYELNLSKKNILAEGAETLKMGKWDHLTILNLQKNIIGPEGAKFLAEASWLSLEDLNLAKNDLGNDGIQSLFGNKNWKTLIKLNLSQNHINEVGLSTISKAFFPSLTYLNLEWNNFQETGALVQTKWPQLRHLYLGYSNIGTKGCLLLLHKQSWESLEYLNLCYNNIDFLEKESMKDEFYTKNNKNAKGFIIQLVL